MKFYNRQATSLIEALNINNHHIICAVGGGGKTTTLYTLANEFAQLGKKVIITTTTHIKNPHKNTVLSFDKQQIKNAFKSVNTLTVGIPTKHDKLKGSEEITFLTDLCDILLIEADGSKRMPLKAPADHEPVIPTNADLVIGIAGASAVGKRIIDTCHRPQLVADILGCDVDKQVTLDDISTVLFSKYGQMKNVTCAYRAMICQGDCLDDKQKIIDNRIILVGESKIYPQCID